MAAIDESWQSRPGYKRRGQFAEGKEAIGPSDDELESAVNPRLQEERQSEMRKLIKVNLSERKKGTTITERVWEQE